MVEGADRVLPPGWDMKYDARTSRYYYINHYTKTTSWEDPREKYQQIGKPTAKEYKPSHEPEPHHIQVQPDTRRAGSPGGGREGATGGRMTPQMGTTSTVSNFQNLHHGAAASPQQLARLQLEEVGFDSPISQRSTLRRDSHLLGDLSETENALTNTEQAKEDELFKLGLMRYLKSVFPTVEEYLLLDVLANSENNVQKASDRLVKMGYVKRDAPSAPRLQAKKKEEERLAEKRTPLPKPPPIKTDGEKEALRNRMKDKYEKKFDIPERILFMALESVLYDEEQANNLVTSMIEDDLKRQKQKEADKAKEKARERAEKKKSPKPVRKIMEAERPPKSPKKEAKKGGAAGKKKTGTKDGPRISRGTSMAEEEYKEYQTTSVAKGPNPNMRKGPNDDLLLTDYVVWNGPDAELRKGTSKGLARGPNPEFCSGPQRAAAGPNPALRKGPQVKVSGSVLAGFDDKPVRSF